MLQEDVPFAICSLISHTLACEWAAVGGTQPGLGEAGLVDLQGPPGSDLHKEAR